MRVAITAASGKLGGAIVNACRVLLGPDSVVAVARTPANAAHLGVEVRRGDYDEPQQLLEAFQGVDSVLLVSGMAAPDKRTGQHRNVIEAAKQAGATKLVYTSVQGATEATAFSPIVRSNRQTESDVENSGLAWVIGRNGIYIEPDVEYIDSYIEQGEIANCAGEGRCGYTTRPELAYAYSRMLTQAEHHGHTYNLHGEPLTQAQLAKWLGDTFQVDLPYRSMDVEAYRRERVAALGDFMGTVIAGIYEGIRNNAFDRPSDFEAAAGRPHQSWADYFGTLKAG